MWSSGEQSQQADSEAEGVRSDAERRVIMSRSWDVAVVGATGLVGSTMLSILEQRQFPVARLYPLASVRSAEARENLSVQLSK